MVWEIDTLAVPGGDLTIMKGIWGNASNNVYTVGWQNNNIGQMWHYNGSDWSAIPLYHEVGGNITTGFELSDIYGTSNNSIWAVGNSFPPDSPTDSGFMLHFDGVEWKQIDIPSGGRLFSINGYNSKIVWSGGAFATLMRYNGSNWSSETVDLPNSFSDPGYYSYISSISGTSKSNLYSLFNTGIGITFLMKYNGNAWIAVDSTTSPFYYSDLSVNSSGTVFYVRDQQLLKWDNNIWNIIYECDCTFMQVLSLCDENIISVGHKIIDSWGYPTLFHFDGVDWVEIPVPYDGHLTFEAIKYIDGELFVVGSTLNSETIIIRGRN